MLFPTLSFGPARYAQDAGGMFPQSTRHARSGVLGIVWFGTLLELRSLKNAMLERGGSVTVLYLSRGLFGD